MNEWYPIPTQYVRANQSDIIRNLAGYLKNPIGAIVTLETPPSVFKSARITGTDLHWSLGDITEDTALIVNATWTVDADAGRTETAQAIIAFREISGKNATIPEPTMYYSLSPDGNSATFNISWSENIDPSTFTDSDITLVWSDSNHKGSTSALSSGAGTAGNLTITFPENHAGDVQIQVAADSVEAADDGTTGPAQHRYHNISYNTRVDTEVTTIPEPTMYHRLSPDGNSATFNISWSENIKDSTFTDSDIALVWSDPAKKGSTSNFSSGAGTAGLTITFPVDHAGDVQIRVAADSVEAADDGTTGPAQHRYYNISYNTRVDTEANTIPEPTMYHSLSEDGSSASFNISWSENIDPNTFADSDIALTWSNSDYEGSTSDFTSGAGTAGLKITFPVDHAGDVRIRVAANSVEAADDGTTGPAQHRYYNISYDTRVDEDDATIPEPTMYHSLSEDGNSAAFNISWSENIKDSTFTDADITLVWSDPAKKGSTSALSSGAGTAGLTITFPENHAGDVQIRVAANSVSAADDNATGPAQDRYHNISYNTRVDDENTTIPEPTMYHSLSSDGSSASFNISWSENIDPKTFTDSDITLTWSNPAKAGSAAPLSSGAGTAGLKITFPENHAGDVQIRVAADSVNAADDNATGPAQHRYYNISYDTRVDEAEVSPLDAELYHTLSEDGSSATLNVSWSEDIDASTFTDSDISLTWSDRTNPGKANPVSSGAASAQKVITFPDNHAGDVQIEISVDSVKSDADENITGPPQARYHNISYNTRLEATPPPKIDTIPTKLMRPGETATISLDDYISGEVNDDGVQISGNESWITLGSGTGVNRTLTIAPPENTPYTAEDFLITATGEGGSDSERVYVYVDPVDEDDTTIPEPTMYHTLASDGSSASFNISWSENIDPRTFIDSDITLVWSDPAKKGSTSNFSSGAGTAGLKITFPENHAGDVQIRVAADSVEAADDGTTGPAQHRYYNISYNTSVEADTDILEWFWFPTIDVFTDSEGAFSGVVVSDLEENLNNPSGATVTLTVASRSATLTGASIDSNGDLSISVKGLTANANANVVVRATGTVGGVERTVEATINFRLVFNTVDLSGYVTVSDISDFVTAGITDSVMFPVTEGDIPTIPDVSNFVTAGITDSVVFPVTRGDIPTIPDVSSFVTAGITNSVVFPVTTGDIANHATTGDIAKHVTAGITNSVVFPVTEGDIPDVSNFVTAGITNSVIPPVTRGDIANHVTAGITNSVVFPVTRGDIANHATTGDIPNVSNFVTAGITNSVVFPVTRGDIANHATTGDIPNVSNFVTAGITNSVIPPVTRGDIANHVTAGITNSVVFPVTRGDIANHATTGDIPNVSNFVTPGITNSVVFPVTRGDITNHVTAGITNSVVFPVTRGDIANHITAGATSGLVTAGITNSVVFPVTRGDLSRFVTAGVTSGLVTSGITNSVVFPVSRGDLSSFVTSGITNSVVFPVTRGNLSSFVTAGVTSGLVTSGITNSVVFPVTRGDLSSFVTAGVTAGLVTSGVTNSVVFPVTLGNLANFVTAGITNSVVFPVTTGDIANHATTGNIPDVSNFVTAGITNSVVFPVTTGDIANHVTAGITNSVVFPVTTGDIANHATTGNIPDVSNFVTPGITNSVVFPVTTGDIANHVTAGITNSVVFPVTTGDIDDFVTAGVTDGLASVTYVNNSVSNFVTAGITDSVVFPVTRGDIPDVSDFVTAGVTDGLLSSDGLFNSVANYISNSSAWFRIDVDRNSQTLEVEHTAIFSGTIQGMNTLIAGNVSDISALQTRVAALES